MTERPDRQYCAEHDESYLSRCFGCYEAALWGRTPPEPNEGEARLAAALRPFGWMCGPDFWKRYYTDPWVFNLANAIERVTIENDRLRRWKVEATEVLEAYHEVAELVELLSPPQLGSKHSDNVMKFVRDTVNES